MQRRRLISRTLVLVCAFGLFLLGVAGMAEAASKFAWTATVISGVGVEQVVYLMNSDGTGEAQLASYTGPDIASELSWSPDGTMLAVALAGPGQPPTNVRVQIIRVSDGSVLSEYPVTNFHQNIGLHNLAWSPEITPTVAAISPLGQLVIVFLLGAVTALYFSRQRGQTSGLVGS
jgi:hypothetical protein